MKLLLTQIHNKFIVLLDVFDKSKKDKQKRSVFMETLRATKSIDFGVSPEEIGRVLREHRARIGLSQSDIAKSLGYANVNFISMIESGKSKIPVNRVDDLVSAYQMSPEFTLVILRAEYPEYLTTIIRLAKRIPRIFKEFISDPDEEINTIYSKILDSIAIK